MIISAHKSGSALRTMHFLLALLMAATAGGCASLLAIGEPDFTCQTEKAKNATDPGAVAVCSGVKAVYKETSNRGSLPDPLKTQITQSASAAGAMQTPATLASGATATVSGTTVKVVHLPAPISKPKPIMEPAQVARIWINYWIDSRGDLHQPGLIYTEVTPRRWAIGQPAANGMRELQPLQVIRDGESGNDNNEVDPLPRRSVAPMQPSGLPNLIPPTPAGTNPSSPRR